MRKVRMAGRLWRSTEVGEPDYWSFGGAGLRGPLSGRPVLPSPGPSTEHRSRAGGGGRGGAQMAEGPSAPSDPATGSPLPQLHFRVSAFFLLHVTHFEK